MRSIGITGGIGAGKSMICGIIQTLGYPVFNSDKVAKNILSTDSSVINQITAIFGESAYINGVYNKPFIAESIFGNQKLLESINAIVHPAVQAEFKSWASQQSSNLVFNEAAILFETNSYQRFSNTILVTSPIDLRITRIKKRDNVTEEQVLARMSKQWPDEKKIPLADYVIVNDESQLIIPQVLETLKQLEAL
ncbi:dephospho-CoA kinase [Crocinitomix catalasitica]|uniref:dephospho-CoA kinase n=1 Tax=Crocinitomix catalasitica TaxID=184607 RepID=UPI0005694203|nr:dephospho-CoA kinase [Crocinitomix catalasitica]